VFSASHSHLPPPLPSTIKQSARVARQALRTALIGAGLIILGLVAERALFHVSFNEAKNRLREVTELSGRILLLDERLTTSAELAAAKGEPVWVARYDEDIPRMDAAIARATALAPPDLARRFDAETRTANDRLVAHERRAFDLLREGNRAQALEVLRSAEYAAQKWVLSEGTARLTSGLIAASEREVTWLLLRAAAIVAGLVLVGFGAIYALLGRRLARTEADLVTADLQLARTVANLHDANQQLTEQNARFDTALENINQGLCFFDENSRLIVANRRYADLYGLRSHQAVPGATLAAIVAARVVAGTAPAGMTGQEYLDWRETNSRESSRAALQLEMPLQDGRIVAIHHRTLDGGGWVATHEDVTERRQAERRIAHMASHDALTGLGNRLLFHERLDALVGTATADASAPSVAVLCLDLDHFKRVNDTLGHGVGDALLQDVAKRIVSTVGDDGSAVIARLGGDEFAVIWTGLGRDGEGLITAGGRLATQLVARLSEPYLVDGHRVTVGASVGIAFAPRDGRDSYTLLKMADLALYRAKARGRGTCEEFDPVMDAEAQARRGLEEDLREALLRGQFELHYQPLLNLPTDRISGFEALLRWNHPTRGVVPPATFIPVAEEIGLIGPLGDWVLRTACAEAATWPAHLKVAVNLSPVQFKSRSLVTSVVQALAASGLLAQRLELEITESVLLAETDSNINQLHQLRRLGVRIAMDDFGTGYSSLSYLRAFPFDKIKIDRSFVRDLGPIDRKHADDEASYQGAAIIRAVAGLGASLGMCITAEGVETGDQLNRVRAEGCTEVQGYHLSPPRPAVELSALLCAFAARDERRAA
jgi:diguanylate cyclase (GGDEF)-like protein